MSMFPLLIEQQGFFSTDLNLERTITFYWLYITANICSKFIICGFMYFNFIYLFYGYAWIAYMCTICMPGAHRSQNRVWDPMGLELQIVVSCHVDAGN